VGKEGRAGQRKHAHPRVLQRFQAKIILQLWRVILKLTFKEIFSLQLTTYE